MRMWIIWVALSGCVVPRARVRDMEAEHLKVVAAMQVDLDAASARERQLNRDLDDQTTRGDALDRELATTKDARDALTSEKANLIKDRSRLRASVADMEEALRDLAARKAASEARVTAYKDLVGRFSDLIDAGRLSVKIVDGRMVVEMATDVLFASGRADLSEEGGQALDEVAAVLKELESRRFQVEGHTDNVPIATERFPSNWELASARAIGVVTRLVEGGVPADRVSASSYAEHRPVADNTEAEGKAANRRIEIVVVPDLSLLPGTDELEAIGN